MAWWRLGGVAGPAMSAGVVLAAGTVLGAGAALAGCEAQPRAADPLPVLPTLSASWTGAPVAAGTFPSVPGYTWAAVPDAEWEQAWTALSSTYHGLLADGQARYVRDFEGKPVGLVVVAWPAPGKGGEAAMKAALEQQVQQAAEHYGTAAVKEVAGHDVLEFDDSHRQPNWYWVSGDELVMVTDQGYDQGAAFVAAFAAETR